MLDSGLFAPSAVLPLLDGPSSFSGPARLRPFSFGAGIVPDVVREAL
jgi:hypothetical protein